MIGIRLILKNGLPDCYDPVDEDGGLTEDDKYYYIETSAYTYEVEKIDVLSVETYQLCNGCGYEVNQTGCDNYACVEYNKSD